MHSCSMLALVLACALSVVGCGSSDEDGSPDAAIVDDGGGCLISGVGWCPVGARCPSSDCNTCDCYLSEGAPHLNCSTHFCAQCDFVDGPGFCSEPNFRCVDADGCDCYCLDSDGGKGRACKSGECCALDDGSLCSETVSCVGDACNCFCDEPDGGVLPDSALGPHCTPWTCPGDAGTDRGG